MRREFRLPAKLEDWVPIGTAVAIILLVCSVGSAALVQISENEFIDSSSLKQEITQLASYGSEGQLLSEQTLKQEAPRTYTVAYSKSLKDTVESSIEKLSSHSHKKKLDQKVHKTLTTANSIVSLLNQLHKEPVNQLDSHISQRFESLAKKLSDLETSL